VKAWIDFDNPPQVQYLAPFVDAFRRRGLEVIVTARDYGITTALLEARGINHQPVGRQLDASRLDKVLGTSARALRLAPVVARGGRPSLLLSTSRSATMAAWSLRIPSFMVLDYEHAELSSFRVFGTTVLHPDVIASDVFRSKGFHAARLVPFSGIKEDISFAGRDIDGTPPYDLGLRRDGVTIVLVRPASETSHYFHRGSRDMTQAVLARLARDASVRVVYSPRHDHQVAELAAHSWANEPIVLQRPVDFIALLKAVDCVVCAGGTMLREAAYLGLPAIGIFQGQIGAVDRWLQSRGLVQVVERPQDLDRIEWRGLAAAEPVLRRGEAVDALADEIVARASARGVPTHQPHPVSERGA